MKSDLLRFDGTLEHDPRIDRWLDAQQTELGAIARRWFSALRACGDEVREILHDGCPVACFGNVPFAYVNVFKVHVNLGFYQGATLPDPARLLEGDGKRMRHVKLRVREAVDSVALRQLVEAAYADIKTRAENG